MADVEKRVLLLAGSDDDRQSFRVCANAIFLGSVLALAVNPKMKPPRDLAVRPPEVQLECNTGHTSDCHKTNNK
jgi:hypothetical protein